jgi:LPS-assembly protein
LDRLVRKKKADNSYKTILNFRLSQSYDLYQDKYGTGNQALSDLVGTLSLDLDQIQSYTQVNYLPYLSATNTLTTLSYLNEQQQYFKIGLSSKRTQEPKQDDISFAIGFVSSYVNVLTGVVFDASPDRDTNSRLKKFSLITQLKPPGECWAVNFYRDQKVGLEAEWKIKFDFSFDGKPTKVIPPAELNIN